MLGRVWTHVRYYSDPTTGLPHIYEHSVSEGEVEEVLSEPTQDMRGRENSRIAIGQTGAGRYLKVIYVPGPLSGACLVITAHELGPKAKRAIRRKRKGRK